MEPLLIETIPYFSDNYCYLIHHPLTGSTALVDCGDAEPVLSHLKRTKWNLNTILLTHNHFDHTSGVSKVIKFYQKAIIYSPKGGNRHNPSLIKVTDGDKISLGPIEIEVISVPAHTQHCTNYYLQGHLFVSDTLFSAGCGRLFEGTPSDLEKAMDRLAGFPPETLIYFGHEYTLANLKFAHTVEPANQDILEYNDRCQGLRMKGKFTTPTTIAQELKINPFLRIDQADVIKFVDPEGVHDRTERIGLLRKVKDQFS